MTTPEQQRDWLDRMTEASNWSDPERGHGAADTILVEIAKATGHEAIAAIYDDPSFARWYA